MKICAHVSRRYNSIDVEQKNVGVKSSWHESRGTSTKYRLGSRKLPPEPMSTHPAYRSKSVAHVGSWIFKNLVFFYYTYILVLPFVLENHHAILVLHFGRHFYNNQCFVFHALIDMPAHTGRDTKTIFRALIRTMCSFVLRFVGQNCKHYWNLFFHRFGTPFRITARPDFLRQIQRI